MNEILIKIGERLRIDRKARGITQAEYAEILEMSSSFYGEVERGKRRLSIEKLYLAHHKLDIDLTYLLTGEKIATIDFSEIIKDCPKEKIFDMEQLLRYASNLYKNK